LSPGHNPPGDPPEPEELVKALLVSWSMSLVSLLILIWFCQDLERSASSDAALREKIANLPPEVSRVDLLNKLRGNFYSSTLISD
jgi:regulator of Ty1 transposition protein 103